MDRKARHRMFWRCVLASIFIGIAVMQSISIAIWDGRLGIAEASLQVFAAGMLFVVIAALAIWWAFKSDEASSNLADAVEE